MLFGRKERKIHRVLVVEDEPLIAFDTEHFLRDAGYEVVATVDRVANALTVVAEGTLDLVVADVRLSAGGTGLDVARAAQEQGIPVLFVSGFCPIDARKLAIGCLAKPYRQRDLLDSIAMIDAHLSGRPKGRMPRGLTLYTPI